MDEKISIPGKSRYPPGYRFMPTDGELILEYLRKKIEDEPIPIAQINETNFKQVDPMDLTAKYPKVGDNEWYFFTPRDRKYPNGARPDRGSKSGYWKATGADKAITVGDEIVGYRKALVFYQGKPQKGHRTNWIMHEFRANGTAHHKTTPDDMRLDDWVLCRIYEKSTRVTNKRKTQSTAVAVDNQEKVVENLPIEDPYSYNKYPHEAMMKNVDDAAAAFGFGDLGEWSLLQVHEPTNLDAGMVTPFNAFGHPYLNQQPQPLGNAAAASSSWTSNNEALFPSYNAPPNSITNFSPFYSQTDAHQHNKR